MPKDEHGHELKVGDVVLLECEVRWCCAAHDMIQLADRHGTEPVAIYTQSKYVTRVPQASEPV